MVDLWIINEVVVLLYVIREDVGLWLVFCLYLGF